MYYYDVNIPHAEHVCNLSIQLYKQLRVLHKLPRQYVKVLRVAALLHDAGMRINYYDHNRHSFYFIVNSNLYGISHRDLVLAAFVAQGHRSDDFNMAEWNKYKDILREEDLVAVLKLVGDPPHRREPRPLDVRLGQDAHLRRAGRLGHHEDRGGRGLLARNPRRAVRRRGICPRVQEESRNSLMRLILASASPRRRRLIGLLTDDFVAVTCDAEELAEGEPRRIAEENSRRKALAASRLYRGTVLGADTVVDFAGKALGKPKDAAEAKRMLRALSGCTHAVITGRHADRRGQRPSRLRADRAVRLPSCPTRYRTRT